MSDCKHITLAHEICRMEIEKLQNKLTEYIRSSANMLEIIEKKSNTKAGYHPFWLLTLEDYLSNVSSVSDIARKFNLHLNLTDIAAKEAFFRTMSSTTEVSGEVKATEENKKSIVWNIPHKDLCIFKIDLEFEAVVAYVSKEQEMKFFIIESQPHPKMAELVKMREKISELETYTKVPSDNEIFGLMLDNELYRAVRGDEKRRRNSNDLRTYSALLLEFGEIVDINEKSLMYRIPSDMCEFPAQAIECILESVDFDKDVKDMKDILTRYEHKKAKFTVLENTGHLLHLNLIEKKEEIISNVQKKSKKYETNVYPETMFDSNQNENDDWDDLSNDLSSKMKVTTYPSSYELKEEREKPKENGLDWKNRESSHVTSPKSAKFNESESVSKAREKHQSAMSPPRPYLNHNTGHRERSSHSHDKFYKNCPSSKKNEYSNWRKPNENLSSNRYSQPNQYSKTLVKWSPPINPSKNDSYLNNFQKDTQNSSGVTLPSRKSNDSCGQEKTPEILASALVTSKYNMDYKCSLREEERQLETTINKVSLTNNTKNDELNHRREKLLQSPLEKFNAIMCSDSTHAEEQKRQDLALANTQKEGSKSDPAPFIKPFKPFKISSLNKPNLYTNQETVLKLNSWEKFSDTTKSYPVAEVKKPLYESSKQISSSATTFKRNNTSFNNDDWDEKHDDNGSSCQLTEEEKLSENPDTQRESPSDMSTTNNSSETSTSSSPTNKSDPNCETQKQLSSETQIIASNSSPENMISPKKKFTTNPFHHDFNEETEFPVKQTKDSNEFENLFISKQTPKQLTKAEIDILMEEPACTSNALKAVMGYVPTDESRLCKYYDPKTGACFKGTNCKLEHTPLLKDGWTKDVKAEVIDIPDKTIHCENGSIITIIPTHLCSVDCFYAQIENTKDNINPIIWSPNDVPEDQKLTRPPSVYDIVLAKYKEDDHWYRAKVVDVLSDRYKVFYVDYGNYEIVPLTCLAKCNKTALQESFQAVKCRILNIRDVTKDFEERDLALKLLSATILNQKIIVQVLSDREDLLISIIDERFIEVPNFLITNGFAKAIETII